MSDAGAAAATAGADTAYLAAEKERQLELLRQRRAPVRLLGIRATTLSPAVVQLPLFTTEVLRRRKLNSLIDEIAERHGSGLVLPAHLQGAGTATQRERRR